MNNMRMDIEDASFDEEDYGLYSNESSEEFTDDFILGYEPTNDDRVSIDTQHPRDCKITPAVSESSMRPVSKPTYCSTIDKSRSTQDLKRDNVPITDDDDSLDNTEMLHSLKKTRAESSDIDIVPNPKDTFSTKKNYCYVCKKPQSKIARHLKKHQSSEPEIAAAYLLPKHSKDRKRLLEKLRNKGNYEHNQKVMANKSGPLKVRRRPVRSEIKLSAKTYVHCIYCKGLFVRKDLWRHTRRCPSKSSSESKATGRAKVLVLADITESTFSQAISPEVWKILAKMKNDDVSSVVRNDFLILQLSQCLYNKHRSDPAKSECIGQQAREMGRLLLNMRRKFSIFNFEEAVRPSNFLKVIEAIKEVAGGYYEDSHSGKTSRLATKLGHSLINIADIILCRAIATEDDALRKAAERFKRLCSNEWEQHICRAPHAVSSKSKFNKPSTTSFIRDVQLLHQYLERRSADAFENLKNLQSSQTYAELAKVTLARVVIFNSDRAGDVSKMTLECFKKRLHEDIALSGLSTFEQKMSKRFSRVEITGKKGRKVSALLNPELVNAIELIVDKRHACEVDEDNPFVFGRPISSSFSVFKGQDCLGIFASQCGAQNPKYLGSPQLRKQVATISVILNLRDNELYQLANILGLDIQVHREFFWLPDATVELAKLSKLLLAMKEGTFATFQGKSLEEIQIEAEIDVELGEEETSDDDDDEEESEPVIGLRGKRKMPPDEAESSTEAKSRRIVKRPWSANEVNAVMKHFHSHISKGALATKAECEHCKRAEDPFLRERTVQNIRDFVRNRGLMLKKQSSWQDQCLLPFDLGQI
nr:uncharacterized protein LOC129443291 isoform X2 [Misgurnus anguillicaudatus]